MGDLAETFNMLKERKRAQRRAFGVPCPTCTVELPRAAPTIMLPEQQCKVCGYIDPRSVRIMQAWRTEWNRQHNITRGDRR